MRTPFGRIQLTVRCTAARSARCAAFALGLVCFQWSAAVGQDDLSELMRAIKELQEQNRALMSRVETIEAERASRRPAHRPRSTRLFARPLTPPPKPLEQILLSPPKMGATTPPKPVLSPPPLLLPRSEPIPALRRTRVLVSPPKPRAPTVSPPSPRATQVQARPGSADKVNRLEQRVKELEDSKAAQEDATRAIIRDFPFHARGQDQRGGHARRHARGARKSNHQFPGFDHRQVRVEHGRIGPRGSGQQLDPRQSRIGVGRQHVRFRPHRPRYRLSHDR